MPGAREHLAICAVTNLQLDASVIAPSHALMRRIPATQAVPQ
jgi:hypothetical protein